MILFKKWLSKKDKQKMNELKLKMDHKNFFFFIRNLQYDTNKERTGHNAEQ